MHVYVNLIVPYLLISYEMYDAYKSYFYIVLLFLCYIHYFGLPRVLFNTCVGASSLGTKDTKGVPRGLISPHFVFGVL